MIGGKQINCGSRKKIKCNSAKLTCKWSNKTNKCSKRTKSTPIKKTTTMW